MIKTTDKLKELTAFFKSAGIEDASKEAEIIITEQLKISKLRLYTEPFNISDRQSEIIDNLALRRSKGEPIQYIIGYVDFYGLKIHVGKGVLIPRPETELLVDEAIKQLKQLTLYNSQFMILDLCTGSGCIAIALAKHFTDAMVYGVDKSEVAISYARQNALLNGIGNVSFLKGDLFGPVEDMKFDAIVSNPPYVKRGDIHTLQREIREHEPVEALDGGKDGLMFYRRILKDASKHIKEKGKIILEIGFKQADDVLLIANKAGFDKVYFIKDYSGIERICIISR